MADKIDKIIKSLKTPLKVQIGILGNGNRRGSKENNATIGAKHEFGSGGMPVRSFLRVPLTDNLQKYLDKALFSKEISQGLEKGDLIPLMTRIGIVGEMIVSDGFNSGGFGKWKLSNMLYKKNHQTLVETQQLRNSITSKVEGA